MEAPHQPSVYLSLPTTFRLFPEPLPRALPPPIKERTFRSPFGIDKDLFNFVLRPEIPITFAAAYVVTVFAWNAYNRRRDHKPWWISRQTWFKYFVVVHNVLLSLYSFATFFAMLRAIKHTLPSLDTPHWMPNAADALCKLHGPRGLGDAATFNTTINIWEIKNSLIHLGYDGNPDPTDVGRLWNEGLAFWGWMFYVSKFYEVIDTFIILAKGKRSATLQTYHHAGAMLCMWAGIRYMSPPIWMFVFINSAIHAMMYTYFALSALGYKVPQSLKRTLTSLQIAQFVFGASYAAAHLFVQYDIPLQIPYRVTSIIERAVSSASSAGQAATKSATSVASAVSSFAESPTVAPTMGAFIKKLLLRAAGEEGVAERVAMEQSVLDAGRDPLGAAGSSLHALEDKVENWYEKRFETRYRSEWTRVNCIDTSGEAFAIYLNLLYLAPLTFLFLRFFVRAYTQREPRRSFSHATRSVSEAAKDASNETEYEVEKDGKKVEDELYKRGSQAKEEFNKRAPQVKEELSKKGQQAKEEASKLGQQAKEEYDKRAPQVKEEVSKRGQQAKEQISNLGSQAKEEASKGAEVAKEKGSQGLETAKQKGQEGLEAAKQKGQELQESANKPQRRVSDRVESYEKKVKNGAEEAKGKAKNGAEQAKDKAKEGAEQANDKAREGAEQAKDKAKEGAEQAEEKSEEVGDEAGKSTSGQSSGKDQEKPSDEKKPSSVDDVPGTDEAKPSATNDDKPADEKKAPDSSDSAVKDGTTYADVVKTDEPQEDSSPQDQDDDKENKKPDDADTEQSEATQDKNMAESQATRPDGDATEDSDAMGQSGSIIDFSKEKAEEASEEAEAASST